jgi:probable HAF family extracellular repeat protein
MSGSRMASNSNTTGRRRALTAIAALAADSLLASQAAAQSALSMTETSSPGQNNLAPARKKGDSVVVRGHGFIRDERGGFMTIDAPRAGVFTIAFGLNDSGQTVGGYVDARGKTRGFLRNERSAFVPIDFPGASATVASKINLRGQVVGLYDTDGNTPVFRLPHGFLLDKGVFKRIKVAGAVETRPYGINAVGQIVGEYLDAAGILHGFLMHQGVVSAIDVPGAAATTVRDVDDTGRIVGFSLDAAGALRGFLRDANGAFTAIDFPGASQTQPFGINNRGQIAGFYVGADIDGMRTISAFLLNNGVFSTVEPPDATTPRTAVFDINDRGQLAGGYDLIIHAYVRDERGTFTTIDAPGVVTETALLGINNRGQTVGTVNRDRPGSSFGLLRERNGRFRPIDVPGAAGVGVMKITDRGEAVGVYSETAPLPPAAPDTRRGFLFDEGEITRIDVPGAIFTQPNDINNRGQIVGEYGNSSGSHGFLRDARGNFITIDLPGTTATAISGNNDRSQLVGTYVDAAGTTHGFLREPRGAVTTIDVPGAVVTQPQGINNRGQIAGTFLDGLGRVHGFVFTDGVFTEIKPPGALNAVTAFDIDDRGRVVGTFF